MLFIGAWLQHEGREGASSPNTINSVANGNKSSIVSLNRAFLWGKTSILALDLEMKLVIPRKALYFEHIMCG
jgi:hypothetical protein